MTATQSDTHLTKSPIFADFGNTCLKIRVENNNYRFDYYSYIDFVKDILGHEESATVFVYSSVNDDEVIQFKEKFKELKLEYLNIAKVLEMQKIIDFSMISGMGNDRKMDLFGALKYKKPPFIVVDLGTAITVNVLNDDFKCCGGFIVPGIVTQAKSLKTYTSKLPFVDFRSYHGKTGRDTVSAIESGIMHLVIGGVKELIQVASTEVFADRKYELMITGGVYKQIQESLGSQNANTEEYKQVELYQIFSDHEEFKEDLVLDGIEYLIQDFLHNNTVTD